MRLGLLNRQNKKTQPIDKKMLALFATFIFILYEAAGVVIYIDVNKYLVSGEGNADYLAW